MEFLCQSFDLGFDVVHVVGIQSRLEFVLRLVDIGLFVFAQVVAELLDVLFGLIDQSLSLVPYLNFFFSLLVIFGVLFRFLDLLFDLVIGKLGRRSDRYLL